MPAAEQTLEELLGDPDDNARDIEALTNDVRALATQFNELVRKYPDKFIAIHQGKVMASSSDMKRLFARMEKLGIPRAHTVVHFIEAHPRDLIL